MKNVPVRYDQERGWICQTQMSLPKNRMFLVEQYVLKVQEDRARCLPPGDRRDHVLAAIERLKTEGIIQEPVTNHQEFVAFQAGRI
jgi:hypothetical protein